MTLENKHLTPRPAQSASPTKPMLLGALIALALIVLFLSGVDEWKPEWGKFWIVKPLLIVPLAGAMGGLFYYFLGQLQSEGRLPKFVAIILGLVGYLVALWLGTVLGLDGTLWD